MTEPPAKRIKHGQQFADLIGECYHLKFVQLKRNEEEEAFLGEGMRKIRETLEQFTSSGDASLGVSKTSTKINWGKCLGLLLEDGPSSSRALKVLNERLHPGGGLM